MVFAFYHQPRARQILEKMVVERFPHSFHFSPLVLIAPLKTWGTLLTCKTIGQNIPGSWFVTSKELNQVAASFVTFMISFTWWMNVVAGSKRLHWAPSPSFHLWQDSNNKQKQKELIKRVVRDKKLKMWKKCETIWWIKCKIPTVRLSALSWLSSDRNISHIWT